MWKKYKINDKKLYRFFKKKNNVIIWYPDFGPWHIGHWYYLNLLKIIQDNFNTKIYLFIDFTNALNFHVKKNLTYRKLKEFIEFPSKIIKIENIKDLNFNLIKQVQNKFFKNKKIDSFKKNIFFNVESLLFFSKRYNLDKKIKFICMDEEFYYTQIKILSNLRINFINFIYTDLIPLPYSRRNLKKTYLEYNKDAIKNIKKFKKTILRIKNE